MLELKHQSISEYSEIEFIQLLDEIASARGGEQYQNLLVNHFIEMVPNPEKSDLIFWPDDGDSSNEAVIKKIKDYCASNSLECFRDA